jgi:iron complex outermembrane receptor protein
MIQPDQFSSQDLVRSLKPEQSVGGTADANFRSEWANLNVMGFWTRVENGLVPRFVIPFPGWENDYGIVIENSASEMIVRGIETNLKLDHEPFALYLGHTFTDTDADLVSRHRFNSVLMIEEEEAWRIGLEAYYHGQQNIGKAYVIAGIMADVRIGFATVFINLENVFDVRQTRFERVYTEYSPTFAGINPLYAPLDGRILNGGVRFEF